MPLKNDLELLREYATQKSEPAFEELVRRHINFVYSAALRQAGDPQLAEEFTQAAFTILAQKAHKVKTGTVVSGWLFNTVRFVAAAEFRGAARRRKYEQEAAMESLTQENHPGAEWQQVVPLLDECLAQLSEADRQAVLLRFFEQKSFAEIGELLGINADAATKRAKRAVEKLRLIFNKRGVVLSTAGIGLLISAHGVQAAPAALAGSVTTAALLHGANATTSTANLIKGAVKLMAWTKLKTTVVAAVIVLALGTTAVTVTEVHEHGRGGHLRFLPDGSFIRLLSTSYTNGFKMSTPPVKPWQQALARRLPSSIASQFDWWLGNSSSMWTSARPGETNLYVTTASERPASSTKKMALVVFDQQGNESLATFGASTIGNQDGKNMKWLQAWHVSAFPRRADTLGLRFVEKSLNNNSWTTAAEFEIPNPAFHKYPVWTPESLPQASTDGDLSVTLTGFTTGLTLDDPALVAILGDVPATRATFRVERPGHPEQSWRPKSIEISDATGNKWTQIAPMTFATRTDDADTFIFAGKLWPSEAAWKLHVEFSRVAGFDPDETWTVRGIPVPTTKEVIKLTDATTIGETKLNLVAITGTKAKQPGDMEWVMVGNMVNLSIHAANWTSGQRLNLVNVWDDRGRPVDFQSGDDWNGGNNAFGVKIPEGAKSLTCTFALHKSRFVEFLAAPEFVGQVANNKR